MLGEFSTNIIYIALAYSEKYIYDARHILHTFVQVDLESSRLGVLFYEKGVLINILSTFTGIWGIDLVYLAKITKFPIYLQLIANFTSKIFLNKFTRSIYQNSLLSNKSHGHPIIWMSVWSQQKNTVPESLFQ